VGVGGKAGCGGECSPGGGATKGLGLCLGLGLSVKLTRLPRDEMRFLTFAIVRPTTVRDFMMVGNARLAMIE
jgi:hypothetical protein